ncbi:hypothetical protein M406DRAFT_46303, partial [Cryphonectria parasitica EP155]
ATQTVLDPRRLGKQNSGFSDDDIADIVCLLLPISEGARAELREMALRTSMHVVDADDAAHPDLQPPEGLSHLPYLVGEQAIILRLSAQVKHPLLGFAFGRNSSTCDIYFANDPRRRLSNIHFRIYFNEYGVLMLEDSSMNGTVVDGAMLKGKEGNKAKPDQEKLPKRRTLNPGSQIVILMADRQDDLHFMVQVPRREGDYEEMYRRNLTRYMKRLQQLRAEQGDGDASKTITPGPSGHVDLFPVDETTRRITPRGNRRPMLLDDQTQDADEVQGLPREWNGSGKYNRVGRIGKGAFATVYMVTAKFDGRPYAAKELDKRRFMKNGVLDQKVENEMKIMQKAKHPNIVEYVEHLDWDNRLLIIIMEYVPQGDLGSLVGDNQPLLEGIVQQMTSQLLSALAYLHANNITHRDVKPDNILVQSLQPFVVKLTDFGLSKMVDTEQTFLKTFCGTLLYCAPEVYNEFAEYDEYGHRFPRNRTRRRPTGQRYDHAIDIWSLGGVLFYALTGQPPFPAKNGISYTELLHQIMTKRLNTQPLTQMSITSDGIDFLLRMLQRRPEQRATIEELRTHNWLEGTSFSQEEPAAGGSQDEEIDEQETDVEEDLALEQFGDDKVQVVDFDRYESQKENYTFDQKPQQPQKLFGEVSDVGDSGALPSNRLNLPSQTADPEGTQLFHTVIKDSFGSEVSTPRQPRKSQQNTRGALPPALTQSQYSVTQSIIELNNLTFDAESQDLGGAESQLENLNMKSLAPSHGNLTSFNTSKRKTSVDTSDEFESTPKARPAVKRLRSESVFDAMSYDEEAEQNLYAQVPPLSRINSNRQIDKPVHKSTYWNARDSKSWHLYYPEMTQLQHDAFASAAKARGESFAPGKSPLWDLAMKHFPPSLSESQAPSLGSSQNSTSDLASRASDRRNDASGLVDLGDIMPPDYSTLSLAHADPPLNRVVALLESAEGSVVSGVSILINSAMVSWGRAEDNTHTYTPKTEPKVPKYGLKIMLWKTGYEPSKDLQPWNSAGDDFHFYISTKATYGLQINRTVLPSHDPKAPRGPCRHWIRLHDGDVVVFWGTGNRDDNTKAKLVFRCEWGGSSRPRDPALPAQLVPAEIADCLDLSCRKAEERASKLLEYDLRLQEAAYDTAERQKNIERERLHSQNFEVKRLEACRNLAMRASGKSSPASTEQLMTPTPAPPNMMGYTNPLMIRKKSAPTLKHASSTVDARALQTMVEE